MILSLLGLLGGGLTRLMPEVFSFLNKRTDNQHELDMLDRQAALEQTRTQNKMQEIEAQGAVDQQLAFMSAQKAAIESQMQKTGIGFVDAANFLVRPLVTYYLLVLYGVAKLATFMIALHAGLSGWDAVAHVYDDQDRAMLSGILGFWFVGRVFDKK